VAEKIRSTEKSSDLIGNRNHDLPGCSIVPFSLDFSGHRSRWTSCPH
jgi:hypothetical protein